MVDLSTESYKKVALRGLRRAVASDE